MRSDVRPALGFLAGALFSAVAGAAIYFASSSPTSRDHPAAELRTIEERLARIESAILEMKHLLEVERPALAVSREAVVTSPPVAEAQGRPEQAAEAEAEIDPEPPPRGSKTGLAVAMSNGREAAVDALFGSSPSQILARFGVPNLTEHSRVSSIWKYDMGARKWLWLVFVDGMLQDVLIRYED